MADDWDLYAVVRSCKPTVATTTTTSTTSTTTINNSSIEKDDSFPSLDSLTFQNDDNPFFIPGFFYDKNDPFQGLEEVYKEFCANPVTMAATTTAATTSIPVTKEFRNQSQPQPPQQVQPIQQQQQQQQQQVLQRGQNLDFKNARFDPSTITFPIASPQPIRPRKRKNQQSKMVRQMTQEELSTDSWAWRKYGQKPIKGSPYPRNYYRCSTSKGCAARKQVERSPTDPNIYIVSYTGEHTHPRPTHRSSLAGSTRTKLSPVMKPSSSDSTATATTNNIAIVAPPKPSCSLSSTACGSSFSPSPNTPLMKGEHIQDDDIEMLQADHDDDDEDMLIPNEFLSEDIFKEFQEIQGTNGSDNSTGAAVGDDNLSFSLLSPPWTPSSSAATNTKFMGGAGG